MDGDAQGRQRRVPGGAWGVREGTQRVMRPCGWVPGWGRKLHRDLQKCGRTGELHKECLRDVQEMHLGFLKDVQRMQEGSGRNDTGCIQDSLRMHRRCKRDKSRCRRDGQRMHWRGRRMQKLQGEGCTGGAQAGRRGAGTFEDVIREQSGHLLIPLLHGKQDCE